jgi:hypothetical protein
MAVGGRHIRHDWKTWVDSEQKSVRTLCGATTKRHLAGIPGVTEQPEIVEINDKKYFGWCTRCAVSSWRELHNVVVDEDVHPYIRPMYDGMRVIIEPIVARYYEKQRILRERDLARIDKERYNRPAER